MSKWFGPYLEAKPKDKVFHGLVHIYNMILYTICFVLVFSSIHSLSARKITDRKIIFKQDWDYMFAFFMQLNLNLCLL